MLYFFFLFDLVGCYLLLDFFHIDWKIEANENVPKSE